MKSPFTSAGEVFQKVYTTYSRTLVKGRFISLAYMVVVDYRYLVYLRQSTYSSAPVKNMPVGVTYYVGRIWK